VLYRKTGGFEKSLRFTEKQADLRNPYALQKNRRTIESFAGVKIPAPGEKTSGTGKAGGRLTV
jgi:hypothetical protein